MAIPIIDMHVHFGAPGDPDLGNPSYWSKEFTQSIAYKAFRLVTGTWLTKLDYDKAKEHVIRLVEKSDEVDQCVLLALDMVYDESDGSPHLKDRTHLFASNEGVWNIVQERPDLFLLGASVHPYRQDWRDELNRCRNEWGAVLCKWIPSAQQINLRDSSFDEFYTYLADYKLPLLCHAGPEYSIPTSDHYFDEFNNPKYLEKALEMGVTVIIPHCTLPFPPQDLATFDPYQSLLALIEKADTKGWALYVDLSALLLFRDRYIPNVLQDIPAQRMLFGSDYPIPMSDLAYKKELHFWHWIQKFFRSLFERNLLDKNYYLLQDMGFDASVFTKANDVFSNIIRGGS
jgi:predicted TIM-barrel fold metal-dependent hydrolase